MGAKIEGQGPRGRPQIKLQLLKMNNVTRNGNQIAREGKGSGSVKEDAAKLRFVLPVTETIELNWQEIGFFRPLAEEVRHRVVEIWIEND
jgi:hypothetical protein